MMVFLAADHGGYYLKEKIKEWLTEWGYEYDDMGNKVFDENDDYPDFAFKLGEKIASHYGTFGIVACRSSAGMVIAANKIAGVRAVSVFDSESAMHARAHNNANVIGISGDWLTEDQAKEIIKTFLETPFSNEERHKRRLAKIKDYELMHMD